MVQQLHFSSKKGGGSDNKNWKHLWRCPLPKTKKELQSFLGLNNFFSKFSPSSTYICKSLKKPTSAKTEWSWDATNHKKLKAKSLIKEKYMCEILWWNKAIIHRDGCIWSWIGSCPTTNKKRYKLDEAPETAYSDPFHLWASTCPAWKIDTET